MFRYTLLLASLVGLSLGSVVPPQVGTARSARVVGGSPAALGEFPFQVSLQLFGSHYCGGTILDAEHVLTAAHCIHGQSVTSYKVRAGSVTYPSGGNLHDVVDGAYHEDFINQAFWDNDVAVVKVSPPFSFGDNVATVTLAEAGTDVDGDTPSQALGWGSAYSGGPQQDDLMKVDLVIYSDADCLAAYGEGPTETTICSGVPPGGKGVCNGDSGGPLLVGGAQVGITSWTRLPCASAGFPAVWTQVSHFRDWIAGRQAL